MKNQELLKNQGSQINTSIGLDLIYFGRIEHLGDKSHRKKVETLRFLIDKQGIAENIDWGPVDKATLKEYNNAEGKKK